MSETAHAGTSPDTSGYDETVVLPDFSEDSLDTVVQPDLWDGPSGSLASESDPAKENRADERCEAGEASVANAPAPAAPVRSANPPMGDDSDTMVLMPGTPQQPVQAMTASTQLALRLIRANGDMCALTSFPVTVGKGSEADLIIGDNSAISRVHVRILRDGNMFAAEDLGSTNKTFIGDYELPPYTPTILSDGDSLRLANEALQVEIG